MSKPLNYPEGSPAGTLGMTTKQLMEHYEAEKRRARVMLTMPEVVAVLRALTNDCNHHPDENCKHRRAASAILNHLDGEGWGK